MHKDYGSESPQTMLEETASSFDGTDFSKVAEKLTANIFLLRMRMER